MPSELDRLREAIADNYTVQGEIGQGGMATVYLAEDTRHHRQVAVKVLRSDLAQSLGAERFIREIEIAAQLQHPHILPLYDSGEADGFLYFVMPYVEGESLRQRLMREGELPVRDTVRLLRDVVDALAKAHARGVVHRDIKPDNVMIADRHAMVTDFGVAKAVSEATGRQGLTTAGVALGTPIYMAPEQAAADPSIDHRADIYAVGIMAYEMLTGEPPFTGTAAQAILAAHMTEDPVPVTSRRETVPEPLAEWVMRCLEKKPADRWQSADEMLARLETIVTPSGGVEPTAARMTATSRPRRGVGMLVAAAAVVTVVVGAVLVVTLRGRGGGTEPLDPTLVVVLPFRVAGADPSLAYLREGMVDMLATSLTGEGGTVRAADPGMVTSAWRRRLASEDSDLDETETLRLTRDLGAAHALTGSIVGSESRLVVRGTLTPVEGEGVAPLQATVEGPADSIFELVPRLVGLLLAQSAGLTADRTANLTTTSLPALRAYLRGQANYRRGHYEDAVAHFAEALDHDGTFALAGVGLVSAAGWVGPGGPGVLQRATEAAWAGRDRMSTRDRALLTAALGPNGPIPSTKRAELVADEMAVRQAADRADAWYYLGDVLFHAGAQMEIPDPLGRAEQAFLRAMELDSAFAGPLQHLVLLAIERGDTAEIRRRWNWLTRTDPDTENTNGERWLVGHALGDTTLIAVARQLFDSTGAGLNQPMFAAPWLGLGLDELPTMASASVRFAASATERGLAEWAGAAAQWNTGRPSDAERALGNTSRANWARIIGAVFWDGDRGAADEAAARLEETGDSDFACVVALWRLDSGDLSGVDTLVRNMRGRGPWPPATQAVDADQLCGAIVAAALEQQRNPTGARDLVERADSLLLTVPSYDVTWENLAITRLLETEGEIERAARAALRLRFYYTVPSFLPTHYREAGRLAELTGDHATAIEYYSKYLELRYDPEPALMDQVAQVQAALAQLTGEGR